MKPGDTESQDSRRQSGESFDHDAIQAAIADSGAAVQNGVIIGDALESPSKATARATILAIPGETSPLLEPSRPRPLASTPYLSGVSRTRFWMIFALILGSGFLACFDLTIMASSHPVIASYFGASYSASWLSTAFLLTSTAVQPLLGRLSDALGRKWLFVAVQAVFALATLWCALAGSMGEFILARAVCGLGAGGVIPMAAIIMSDLVPIEFRGTYQGYINIAYGTGTGLGAALGGAMADLLGWRWEFGIQVPPILLAVVVAVLTIPDDLGLKRARENVWTALKAFDFRGSVLLTLAVTFLVLGLNLGGNIIPWSHPFVTISLLLFVVLFPLFLWVESWAERPIIPLYLISRAPRANLLFGNALIATIANAILFNIPIYFQAVLLTSATDSGLRLAIPSVIVAAAGAATGFLITYTRRLKWPIVAGSLINLFGTIGIACMRRSWPATAYVLCLIPSAIGQGMYYPGAFMSILAMSEQSEQAVVTSVLLLWRSIGTTLGVACSSLVMQNALIFYLERFVTGDERWTIIALARNSVESISGMDPQYREQVVASYEAAVRLVNVGCVGVALLVVAITLPVQLPRMGQRK